MLPGEARDGRRAAGAAARALTFRNLIALALALAAGVIAGCGEEDDSTTTSPSTTPGASGETALVVTLDPDGKGGEPAVEELVSCPGPDKPACEAVAALPPDSTAEIPPDTACTEIYGGPDTLVVRGKLNGEVVNARLDRSNGCEIERFERFVPLLKVLFGDYEPGQALGA